jgi:hypothetical protein
MARRTFIVLVLSALSFSGDTLNAQEATREETNEQILLRKRKEQSIEKVRGSKHLNPPQPGAMLIRPAPESSLRAELYRRQRARVFDRPIDNSLLGLWLSCKKIPNSYADRCFYGTNRLASEKQFLKHELKQEKS